MRTHRRRAISVLELLAVCGVVGLLLGQALPAAHQARSSARRTECLSKIGQIARAGLVYAAQDPNELAIPIGEKDAESPYYLFSYHNYGGKSGRGAAGADDAYLTTSDFAGAAKMNAARRPLNAILYKQPFPDPSLEGSEADPADWSRDARLDLDTYYCPGDRGFTGLHHDGWRDSGLSSYNFYGTSYIANADHVRDPSKPFLYANSPYKRPISGIINPAKTLLYLENAARFALFAPNTEEFDQSGCYWNTELYRRVKNENMVAHGNHGVDWSFTTARVDGSTAFVRMKGHGRVLEAPGLGPFCDPYGNGGERCDCIYIRGIDWQRDILPADPIETHKTLGQSIEFESPYYVVQ